MNLKQTPRLGAHLLFRIQLLNYCRLKNVTLPSSMGTSCCTLQAMVSSMYVFDVNRTLGLQDDPTNTRRSEDLLCYILQKAPCKKVVADVSSTVHQLPSRSSERRCLRLDLAVLHYLGHALHTADHAHWLSRVHLSHHLTGYRQEARFILLYTI